MPFMYLVAIHEYHFFLRINLPFQFEALANCTPPSPTVHK
jgi:hypothetical protein